MGIRVTASKKTGNSTTSATSRNVRMRDVAELAGVGTMTVSRVMSGSVRVTEETTSRVYRAIEQLRYKPNQLARALRGSRSNTIGVLVPYLYDPFFATCAHAISMVAKQHSYSVILTTTNESSATELEEASQMVRRQVDGLILIPSTGGLSEVTGPEFRDLPIVALDRPIPESSFDSVLVENKAGVRMGVQHLIEHGHRRICFVGLSRDLYTMSTRFDGYEAAMKEAGLKVEAHFDLSSEEAMVKLLTSFSQRSDAPSAIFAANGLTTRYALHALSELGVEVPRQMALASFDDFELADILQPALTVVRQPVRELGKAAAELLFRRLHGEKAVEGGCRIRLPVELVVRRSCGCEPARQMGRQPIWSGEAR